jgi:hypothetical protein
MTFSNLLGDFSYLETIYIFELTVRLYYIAKRDDKNIRRIFLRKRR